MSANPITETRTEVTLLRLGSGRETIELPEGATLGDLLRWANLAPDEFEILIDGKPLLDNLKLPPNAIVSVSPKSPPHQKSGWWKHAVGMFQDDPLFDEAVEAGREYRNAQRDASRGEGSPVDS